MKPTRANRPDSAASGKGLPMRLNPALDREALAERLARDGRLQVLDVLETDSAEAVARCLEVDTPWSYTFWDGQAARVVPPPGLAGLPAGQREGVGRFLMAQARAGFSYSYSMYPMQDSALDRRDPGLLLHQVFDFLNGPQMLDLIRTLLRRPGVGRADAQATRFGPGDFLTVHDDLVEDAGRECAYVLNFTRQWRTDWGARLDFYDAHGNGEGSFKPNFNSLNLFRIPRQHAVTFVPPFAGGYRYAISGWYLAN